MTRVGAWLLGVTGALVSCSVAHAIEPARTVVLGRLVMIDDASELLKDPGGPFGAHEDWQAIVLQVDRVIVGTDDISEGRAILVNVKVRRPASTGVLPAARGHVILDPQFWKQGASVIASVTPSSEYKSCRPSQLLLAGEGASARYTYLSSDLRSYDSNAAFCGDSSELFKIVARE